MTSTAMTPPIFDQFRCYEDFTFGSKVQQTSAYTDARWRRECSSKRSDVIGSRSNVGAAQTIAVFERSIRMSVNISVFRVRIGKTKTTAAAILGIELAQCGSEAVNDRLPGCDDKARNQRFNVLSKERDESNLTQDAAICATPPRTALTARLVQSVVISPAAIDNRMDEGVIGDARAVGANGGHGPICMYLHIECITAVVYAHVTGGRAAACKNVFAAESSRVLVQG
ncbi:hypothetical protein EVAR_3551_1 [Eumeta japonica]|uniref:Uncharacterized protein n=1 Tax=Eumeta variegata TaxID=151549 RepID=A0A4C1SYD4_EUMVA|nr:hypothetical protein EVAR_3551_1 [Eumeta japonica]